MSKSGCRVVAALAILLSLLIMPSAHSATGRAECRTVASEILKGPVNYCILLPPSYETEKARRYPILYYLHGLGDSEQFLVQGVMAEVEDLRSEGRLGEFLIVTPAGDSSFYINSRDGKVRYEDFLLHEFMPEIERRYRVKSGRSSRGIGGISMGGYGALHAAFEHPEMFAAVSVTSAALIQRLPSASGAALDEVPAVRLLGHVFGSPPDRAFWDRNNPLVLARTANLNGLKIYFDCGSEDDYGFYAGADALNRELDMRHIPHEFHIYPGGHDAEYFVAHVPASLEFQSKAFGLKPIHP